MFAVTPLQFLEYGALKNPHSVREVNEMLREISLPLLFVPLEKHPPASLRRNSMSMHEMYIHHTTTPGHYSTPSSFARAFHLLSTNAFVFASITISSGQGRVKPSVGHLRVASMPILEP